MNTNKPALGIDGGATRFKWMLREADGQTHQGETSGANLQSAGWDNYLTALEAVIQAATQGAGIPAGELGSAGLGLAGVDRPAERERLRSWLSERLPGLATLWVGNDAWPALRAGLGSEAAVLEGVILIGGTGSIALGAAPAEERAPGTTASAWESLRVGGWGDVLGDEGSAYAIGRDLLAAAMRMEDGRIPVNRLLSAVLERLELGRAEQIITWLAERRETRKTDIAALAPLIFDLASAANPTALGIVHDACHALAELALTAAARLDRLTRRERHAWTVVLAGGLLDHRADFRGAVEIELLRAAPQLRPRLIQAHAAWGALRLGQEQPAI